MSDTDQSQYNGPGREKFLDQLADYEEQRFLIMRHASLAGKIMEEWEKNGGDKDDLRDGYKFRKMTPEEQQAEHRRRIRVAGFCDIVSEDASGQMSMLMAFDAPRPVPAAMGIAGAPLGSKLSVGRARAAGFNEGKTKGDQTVQDGLQVWVDGHGWALDGEEALAYRKGYREGLPHRPASKPKKVKEAEAPPADVAASDAAPEPDAKPKRARAAKVNTPSIDEAVAKSRALHASELNASIARELSDDGLTPPGLPN